jgi:hypothetical protein
MEPVVTAFGCAKLFFDEPGGGVDDLLFGHGSHGVRKTGDLALPRVQNGKMRMRR